MSFRLSNIEIPFKKEEFTFDYSKVPEKYHADENPEEIIKLYKAARAVLKILVFYPMLFYARFRKK